MSEVVINTNVLACSDCPYRNSIDIVFEILTIEGEQFFSLLRGREKCHGCEIALNYLGSLA